MRDFLSFIWPWLWAVLNFALAVSYLSYCFRHANAYEPGVAIVLFGYLVANGVTALCLGNLKAGAA